MTRHHLGTTLQLKCLVCPAWLVRSGALTALSVPAPHSQAERALLTQLSPTTHCLLLTLLTIFSSSHSLSSHHSMSSTPTDSLQSLILITSQAPQTKTTVLILVSLFVQAPAVFSTTSSQLFQPLASAHHRHHRANFVM